MLTPQTHMVERLKAYWMWVQGGNCIIKDRNGNLGPLVPSKMQQRIYTTMLKQAMEEKPIRIVGLKARKEGFSTDIESKGFFLTQNTPHWASGVIAHTDASTSDIFGIAKRMADNIQGGPRPSVCKGNKLGWPHDSTMTLGTAGGQFSFSGSTLQLVHLSELAKWAGSIDFVKSMLASTMQSVPKHKNTIVVIESTANMIDLSGQFEAYWEATKDPENPYVGMFFPWFDEPSYSVPGGTVENVTEYEQWLMSAHGVTQEQLRWRRDTILGEFAGDERFFKQEYPATDEEAFETPKGVIYPMLSEKKHAKHYDVQELLRDGYRVYRGIDFGGVDPFVTLWIAHKRGQPGFSVDEEACPKTWQDLKKYHWGPNGRPAHEYSHACDALRYIVHFFSLTGHVHVFREIYRPETVQNNVSLLDLTDEIKQKSKEPVRGSVADRSRPDSIQLMSVHGVVASAFKMPISANEHGEKQDGIMRLKAMMVASLPLRRETPPEPWWIKLQRQIDEMPVPAAVSRPAELIVAMESYERETAGAVDPVFGAYD